MSTRPKLTPEIAYNLAERLYKASGECNTRLESVIARSSYYAFSYAWHILKGPFPAGEPAIMQHSIDAYLYARDILKCPWPEAEPAIAQDTVYSHWYAREVLKTPEDHTRFKEVQRWVDRS